MTPDEIKALVKLAKEAMARMEANELLDQDLNRAMQATYARTDVPALADAVVKLAERLEEARKDSARFIKANAEVGLSYVNLLVRMDDAKRWMSHKCDCPNHEDVGDFDDACTCGLDKFLEGETDEDEAKR